MRMRGSLAGPERVVALAPGLSLLLPDGTPPGHPDLDAPALGALLAGPPVAHPTGVRVTGPASAQVFWGLGLWLAAHEPRSCRLGEERSASAWLIRAPLRGPGWQSTLGLLDAGGLAILASAAESDRPGLVTLDAVGFGPHAARLAAELTAHVQAWGEAGQPGIAGLHVDAYPRSAADDARPIADALTMERPGMRFAVYHD
jgi:protein-L-isoaspartate(D-aspartate) O-methyltransferase